MNGTEVTRDLTGKCPECGAPLPGGALAGLCPACLLKQGAAADSGPQPGAKPFEPPPVAEVARLFPQFQILGFLGKGGMGAVYKARQPALDRFVALKILPAQGPADAGFAERFTREARALARLSHPNIVGVHEFGQVDGLHFFVMEFVDGVNLRQLQKTGRLSPREALQIVPQICDALQYAHDEGVVHRDIKPENVLVDRKGRVKIADFGLAKILGREAQDLRLTGEGQVMGTPHYMAPEQVEHPLAVDHRADIFSLGVVFYEMLTGELPLGKFAPPSSKVQVDVRLDDVVLHALEKEPDRRYQHVSEVKTAVQNIASGPPAAGASGPQPPLMVPVPRWAMGVDYRSKGTLWGLPLLHVATGMDPGTGKPRVATGVIAIGNVARGGVAIGGMAMGGIALGGVALGGIAFGGLGLGVIAIGGLALALLGALGGGAVAPIAVGGGAVGYWACGGGAWGVHALSGLGVDPAARDFFAHWAGQLVPWAFKGTLLLGAGVILLSALLPAWLQRHDREVVRRPAYWGQVAVAVVCAAVCGVPAFLVNPRFDLARQWAPKPSWSPTLAPDEKPDPNKVRNEANELRAKGQYQAALDRYRWYWDHALEYQPSLSGVRLSFLLSDWVELGRRYPAAQQALLDLRARDTQAFLAGRGHFDLFMDVSSLNECLQDEEATYKLFKKIQQQDAALAGQCFLVVEPLLVKHGDYALCFKYIGDPESAFSQVRQNWEMLKQSEQRWEESSKRAGDTATGFHPPPPPRTADRRFVEETCQLILILVKSGHKAEGEHIRDEAVALLDDPRLKSAVSDAEAGPASNSIPPSR
jgi:predicted Ser/Thr protein kinase